MAVKMFALVKWLDGEDAGKYTPGVPITWIHDFDMKSYFENEPDEPYVVEWRNGKKPKGGWLCYDVIVAEVADNVKTLERRIKAMDGSLSPKTMDLRQQTKVAHKESNNGKSKTNPVSQKPVQPFKLDSTDESSNDSKPKAQPVFPKEVNSTDESSNDSKSKAKSVFQKKVNFLNLNSNDESMDNKREVKKFKPNEEEGKVFDEKDYDLSICDKPKGIENLLNDNYPVDPTKLDLILKVVIKNQAIMKETKREILEIKSKMPESNWPSTSGNEASSIKLENQKNETSHIKLENPKSDQLQKIEIGIPGSGAYVTKQQWKSALKKPTYTNMGISLLTSVFPLKTLLESNLKGGTSKRGDGPKNPRKPLNEQKLKAIEAVVHEQFSEAYNEQVLRIAINNKLSSLRSKNNNNEEKQKNTSSELKEKEETADDDETGNGSP